MVDFTRLDKLLKESGITAAHLCELVGRNRGYIKDCRNKGTRIPESTILIWSQALHCTPEYLQGEEEQKEKPAGIVTDELDAQCLVQFRRLDPNQRRLFLAQLKAAADMQEAAASSPSPEEKT